MPVRILTLTAFFLLVAAMPGFSQVDVMFEHDFENQADADTPDLFVPSGSANPDWDNAVLDPLSTGGTHEIATADEGGNATKKLNIDPTSNSKPLLLGASFNPSSDRYVVVEYDALIAGNANFDPVGEIIYADGYGDLDGTGGNTKIAIHVSFNDDSQVPDDNGGGNGEIYRRTGEDNDVSTIADATEWTTGIPFSTNKWYRVQVVADQENKTFDLKVTELSTGQTSVLEDLPYDDPAAGYIRKVWFASSSFSGSGAFFDNIYVYETLSAPPPTGPTITLQEYDKGPVNANVGLDVDFSDDVDLAKIQYRIGIGGVWTDLTSDGTNTFNLTGGADTSVTSLVYLSDANFTAMAEGSNTIYFRGEDSDAFVTEGAQTISFTKDTEAPDTASVTTPSSSTISSLTSVGGSVGDSVSGVAVNSATFTLQRQDNSQYWNGSAWQVGSVALATTHAATSDGTSVSWANSGTLPSDTGVNMTVQATLNDNLANGSYTGGSFAFIVNPGFPGIQMNVTSVGPARNNGFAAIDVDFSDETDLQSIQYKIGAGGTWTDLTSDGVNTFSLGGAADTSVVAVVYITDVDYASMSEGANDIYFRAVDSVANTTDTSTAFAFKKDTQAPATATFTTPASNPFSSLPTVAGELADASNGFGFGANSATFTIQRQSDSLYWDGSAWGAGSTSLPASHGAASDDSTINWVKNAGVPTLADLTTGVNYTFSLAISDLAGNSTTNPVVYLFDDVPEISSITSPTGGSVTGTPFSIGGKAADHEGGAGLNANSTTFTLVRNADGWYWDGVSAWQSGIANLATTHAATTSSNQVTWSPAGTMPAGGDLSDGSYSFQATATDIPSGTFTGTVVAATYDANAPTINSGTLALDNSYVTVQFSESVWSDGSQTTAIAPSDLSVTFVQNGGAVSNATISGLYQDSGLATTLNATSGYSTVYAALNNTGGPATGAETIEIKAVASSIYDIGANAMANTQTTGTLSYNGSDAIPPTITGRDTADLDGDGSIDAVLITFDEAILDTSVTASNFDIAGVTGEGFSSTTNGDTADDVDIYVTFADGVLATDATPNVTYTAGTLTDLSANALANNGPIAATDVAGPAILTAVASDETNIIVGIDNDDTVTVSFSENTNQPVITAGTIAGVLALNNGHGWLDGAAAIGSANWSDAATLVITLSDTTSDPTVGVGDTITLDGTTVTDGTNNSSTTAFSSITGTFSADTTPPALSSVSTADTDSDGYIDRLVATFAENVNDTTIVGGNFSTNIGTVTSAVDDGTSLDPVIWVNLTDAVLYSDEVPQLTIAAGGIADLPGNQNVLISNYASIDAAAPVIMTATSLTSSSTLTVRFSEPVDTSNAGAGDLVPGDFSYANNNAPGATSISSMGADADGTDEQVTLTMDAGFVVGDFASDSVRAVAAQVYDLSDNAAGTTAALITSSDATAPTITGRDTVDLDGDGYIDAIHVSFDEPILDSTVTATDFTIAGGSNPAFSSTTAGDTADDADIYVTFDDGAVITSATPNVTYTAGTLTDLASNNLVTVGPVAAADTAGPAVFTAVVSDQTNILVGIDNDDTVTVTFSEGTNQPVITAGTIDTILTLSSGHSWLDGAGGITSAAWSDAWTLVITLNDATSDPTVAVGDSITLDGTTITDGTNNSSTVAFSSLTGTFSSDTTPPSLSSVTTADVDSDGYIDRLITTFDENVDDTTIVGGNFNTSVGSVSSVVDDGTSQDAVIWVNLTDNVLASDQVPLLTIAAGGIKDLPGNANTLISNYASADAAGPAILSAVASDAPNIIVGIDPDDTVTITFSEVTNAPVIDDTNIDSVLDLGANSWKDGASAIGSAVWSGGDTILTVTLSDATSDPTVAVSDTITLDGATVTDGTTASVNVAFSSITGTFSADTTPPDISTLTTADIDADGYIDRLIVTFDEAVDDTTMVGAGFSTDIGSVASVVDDGTSQDTVIWVNITDAVLATDQVPQLTIAATSIKDLPGTWNVLISNAVSADSAAPVIMSVSGVEGTTTLTATFSEPVDTSNAGAGDLIGTDFGYADGNAAGATGITSIGADADGTDSTVSIAVNATLVAGDTADSVAAVASEIFDLADNGAGVAAKAIAIDELPELSSVITTDVDGDGYTDRLVATFDENVDEATIAPASFTVNLGSVATVVDDGVASDATIWVNLTDGALATDAVPQLSIAAGGIKDTAGNANATISNYASTDGAAPRLMSAAAVEGSTSATVTFSEAVDTSNVGAGDSADSIPATAAQIYDLSNNAALTTGVSMAVDQLPELSSVTTVDSDGDGYVDRLIAVFDENVDESTIVPASFTTSAGSVTTVVDDGTGGNAVIHVELTDGSLATDSVPLLSIAVDGIKDLAGNGNAAITNYASTDGAGPAILSAAASDETNILVGVDNDDRVVITFSEATNQPAVSAGNIDTALALSGGHSWLDGAAAITSAAWSGATVLTVTLSDTTSDPTAVAGDTITLDGTTITDGTNNGTTVASGAIIGTFSADSTPPSLSTVTTADTDSDGYIDRLVATFAENVDATTITAAKFSTNIGTVSTLVDDGVLSNAVIYVDMSDGALLSDAVPLLSIAVGGIKDLPGNENATITDFASTDAAAPVILSATGVATQTTLTVTFSEPVDTSNAGAGNLVLGDFSYADGNAIGATVLSVTGDADGTDEVVTITVNGGFDPSDMGGDTLAAVAGQIYDLSDNAASTGAVALQTSDLTTPTITVRETKDLDGDGSIDALKISFDEPVLDTSVTSANFDIAGVAGEGFSSTTAGDIADNSEIYITFADGVLATDATPNVTYTAGTLTDLAANALASTGAVASVDAAGPAILSAVASDETNISVGVDSDDSVTVTFSEATNAPVINAAGIDTVLDLGGNTWKDGALSIGSAVWSGGNTILTITLSDATSDPTVAVSDTISLDGSTITDGTTASATVAFSAIGGTFSADSTAPSLSAVTTADTDGDGYIDRLVATFDENVDDTVLVPASFTTNIGSVATVTDDGVSQDAVIWVELTDGAQASDAVPLLSIAAAGITDLPGNANIIITDYASTDAAGPGILSAVASDESNIFVGVDSDDTVTITFSEATNGAVISAANIDTVLDLGANSWRDGASAIGSAAWSGGDTVLTITLSDATGDPSVVVSDAITLDGSTITDGTAASTNVAFSAISGTFSADATAPSLSTLTTADTDTDGYIDRLIATFDENVDDTVLVPAGFTTNIGSVSTVTDNGASKDAVIWVELTDGVLTTDAVPLLSVAAAGITDVPGNAYAIIANYASTDSTAPAIIARETADLDEDGSIDALHITLSEAISDASVTAADFDVAGVTGEAFSSTTGGDTADDSDIYITFTDAVLATDSVPNLTYTAGTLADANANIMNTNGPVVSIDKAGPVILSVVASDAANIFVGIDNDDTVTVTLSESTNKAAITSVNINSAMTLSGGHTWRDGAAAITSAVWNGSGDVLTVTLSDTGSDPTVAVGDTIILDGTTITDGTNGSVTAASASMAGTFSADTTAPSLASVTTADTDGDGYIDRLNATFDENVDESTIVPARYSVSLGSVASVVDDGTSQNAVIWVNLSDGVLTTDVTPQLTIAAGGIKDLPGNANVLISNYGSTDSAGPAILAAMAADNASVIVGVDGDDSVTLSFSETTNSPAINAGNINTVFALSSGHGWLDGVSAITAATWTDARTLEITLSVTSGAPTVAVADTITLDGVTVTDGTNSSTTVASSSIGGTFSSDSTPPALLTVTTGDTDTDGYIDRLVATFDENVDEGTIISARFSTDVGSVASVIDDGVASSAIIWINLTDGVLYSDATPQLTITARGIEDIPGNGSALISNFASIDNAAPVIHSVSGIAAGTTLTVRFSEAVDTSNAGAGDLVPADFSYADNSGTDAGAISSMGGDADATDGQITLTVDAALAAGDFGVDTVSAAAAQIYDLADNAASAAPFTLATSDVTAPTITARETRDLNGDGYIEAIRIALDEPILDSTVSAADFDVAGVTGEAFSSTTAGDVADNNELYLTFDDGILTTAAAPNITYTAGTLSDFASNLLASNGPVAATDSAGPAIVGAVASDEASVLVGVDADDTVTITFSEATDKPVITNININSALTLSSGHSWLDGSGGITSAAWDAPGSALTVTLSNTTGEPTIVAGDSMTLDGSTIKDGGGNGGTTVPSGAISGTFSADSTAPSVSGVVTQDTDSDGYVDRLVASFTENVDAATIAAGNFSTDIGTVLAVTDDGTALDPVIHVELTDGVATSGELPKLSIAAGGIEDLPGNANALVSNYVPTDAAGPAIVGAVASDEPNVLVGIDNDDTVTITFSEATNKAAINNVNIDSILDLGANSWLDGASGITSAAWNGAGDTLTVTLSVVTIDPTVVVGDTITLDGATITDGTNASVSVAYSSITGSFSADTTPPTLNPVSVASDNLDTAFAKVGDTVTMSFTASEALNGLPTVTIDGNAADSVNDLGSNNYTATRLMQTGDTQVAVSFTIDFTDAAGNAGAQVTAVTDATSVTFDETVPAGYTVVLDQAVVNTGNKAAVSFTFAGAEGGADYSYSMDDTNGATTAVSGSGTIAGATDQVTGIDVSSLDDDTLTLTVYLTDGAGNQGTNATDTVGKETTAPALSPVSISSNNAQTSVNELLSPKLNALKKALAYGNY